MLISAKGGVKDSLSFNLKITMCIEEKNISYEYFLESSRNSKSSKRLVILTEVNRNGKIEANFVIYRNDVRMLTCKSKIYAEQYYNNLTI